MQTTITFSDGDQITSAKLNEISTGMSFESGDITGSTLAIVGGQLKVGTITSSEMGAGSATETALATDAVTTEKIADGSITTGKVANLAITGAKIASGTITITNISTALLTTSATMEAENSGFMVTPNLVKRAPGAAKAYGEFNTTDSSRAIKGNSVNVASLTRVDSTHTTVTLTTNMVSENYTVLATFVCNASPETGVVSVYDKAVGSFKIMHPAEAGGRAVNFVVFGKYA